MDGLDLVRRGLILAITASLTGQVLATEPCENCNIQPVQGWSYYNVPNGPYITAGVGRGGYIGPGAYRGGWWGVPGAAGTVWTNNLSLYGPPIPTYAPVPGVFGNADQSKLFFQQPPPGGFYGIGLGWTSRNYSPSPRPITNVSVYPALPPSVIVANGGPTNVIRVCVKVPDANADLWVEQKALSERGFERHFESPILEPGQSYKYQIIARWTAEGRDHAQTRTVTAKPGDIVQVDFNLPQE